MITKLFTEFNKVKFFNKDHTYTLNGVPMKSVTTVVKQYGNEFDTDYWTTYKALEGLGVKVRPFDKDRRLIWADGVVKHIDHWRKDNIVLEKALGLEWQWKVKAEQGRRNGTLKHKYMEDAIWGKFMYNRDPLLDSLVEEILDKYLPVRTEMVVYDEDCMIAGQVDLLAVKCDTRELDLIDYKTDEEIKIDNPYQNFKKPIDYLEESTLNKYTVQLNLYRYLLEKKGVAIDEMKIIHLSGSPKWYSIERIDIKPLINDYNKKRAIHSQRVA